MNAAASISRFAPAPHLTRSRQPTAAQHTLQFLFNPERAARLVEFHARDGESRPRGSARRHYCGNVEGAALGRAIRAKLRGSWTRGPLRLAGAGYQRTCDHSSPGSSVARSPPIKGLAQREQCFRERSRSEGPSGPRRRANRAVSERPKKLDMPAPSEPPDGPPIGDDEEFFAVP